VLEDRGPADELAPAAVARSLDGDDLEGLEVDAESGIASDTPVLVAEPEAEASLATEDDDGTDDDDEEAEDVPAAEERAEA
jgi:hypothetical protein